MRTSAGTPSAATSPAREQHQPVGKPAGKGQIVERGDNGQSIVLAQGVDDLEHLQSVPDVEIRSRLIEKQHRRLLGERPGEDRSLRLATGESTQRPSRQLRPDPADREPGTPTPGPRDCSVPNPPR